MILFKEIGLNLVGFNIWKQLAHPSWKEWNNPIPVEKPLLFIYNNYEYVISFFLNQLVNLRIFSFKGHITFSLMLSYCLVFYKILRKPIAFILDQPLL